MSAETAVLPSLDVTDIEGVVAGGLFGAFQAGVVMQIWHYGLILELGSLVGVATYVGGWSVLLTAGVLFAVPFVGIVSGSVHTFSNKVIMLSRRSELLQRILVPLLKFSAFGVTCFALGQMYGLALGVGIHLFVVPVWLTAIGQPTPIPYLTVPGLGGVVGWTVYGGMMGFVYGFRKEG